MAESYSPSSQRERELIGKIQTRFEGCRSSHDLFVREYDRREAAYRGLLKSTSDAAKWKHKLHPPYGFNLIETIVSNTVEQGLAFDVRPNPHSSLSLEEATRLLQQTDAVSDLLAHEHRIDGMDAKQRPLFLTAAIGGRGVGKCYWNYTERSVRRQGIENVEIRDHEENLVGTVPQVTEIVENGVFRDHSTMEVVDPRDFIVHESAKALQPWEPGGAQYLFHRCWYSWEQLALLQASDYLKNVEYLRETREVSEQPSGRSSDVFKTNQTKDLIEVWEYWCMEDGEVHRVIMSATGVILRDLEQSPFWHGQYPFFLCSSMPQPFTTIGVSDVEQIEQLQEILWELMNQRLDNVELINNFITLIRDTVEDPDAYDLFPGARWLVENPQDVEAFQPPIQVAEATIHAEALVKGDMQNVTSAVPFAGGADSQSVDNATATGASIIMNAAQSRMIAKKWQSMLGLQDEANIRIQNCQQFMDGPKLVHLIGKDGATAFREIEPLEIQGDFFAALNPESDSNMRQERRAEASQFFQIALTAAPVMAASGAPLNIAEVFKWWAKKFDILDYERFLSVKPEAAGPAAMPAGGGGGGGQSSPDGQPEQPNLGVTAPATPGAEVGASPATALQRALTMSGGPANTPAIPGR